MAKPPQTRLGFFSSLVNFGHARISQSRLECGNLFHIFTFTKSSSVALKPQFISQPLQCLMARVAEPVKTQVSPEDDLTAQLNAVYAEEDSRLTPELEALSDEILDNAFNSDFTD
jgi:hypothetical protein